MRKTYSVFSALTHVDHCSVSLVSLAYSFLLQKIFIRGSRLLLGSWLTTDFSVFSPGCGLVRPRVPGS